MNEKKEREKRGCFFMSPYNPPFILKTETLFFPSVFVK